MSGCYKCKLAATAILLQVGTSISASATEKAGMYLGASSSSSLGCVVIAPPDPVRGLTIGCTFFDLQKYGSMGRQTAITLQDQVVYYTWTNQDNNAASAGRNVRFEAYDPPNGALGDGTGGLDVGPGLIPPDRSGFVTIEANLNGSAFPIFDWNKNFGAPGSRFKPSWALGFIFFGFEDGGEIDTMSWIPHLAGNAVSFNWPQLAVSHITPFPTHVVVSGNRTDADNLGLYIRRPIFNSFEWDPGVVIGEAGYERSFVITSSQQSNRVAIAWSGGRGDGTEFGSSVSRFNNELSGKNDNDIYVMISEDAGLTWGPKQNVTQRASADPGGWAPHAKLSILFDQTDSLHVAWQAVEWVGYSAEFNTRSRMFHWSENRNTVRTAVEANWDPSLCNGGDNTLNLDNPQLSSCNNKLYLTYTQFAPVPLGRGDDCAQRAFEGDSLGAANGDIYLSVSSDGGQTWDAPRNLTNTYTPQCDTLPGSPLPDCDSDVWHSVIRYGIDITGQDFAAIPDLSANIDPSYTGAEFLFAQYINDSDPGAAIRGEGGWTNNSVIAFRFGCVEQVATAVLASSLPEASVFMVPEILVPATDTTLDWVLENIGATDIADLTISVSNSVPPGAMTVSGFSSVLNSGANNSGTISLRANGIPLGTASADLIVNGTFAGAPKTFSVSYTLLPTPCCKKPGNINDDALGKVGIADVTFLIARIFAGGLAPPCCEQADLNGDGSVNIADITYLIARMFAGGPPPICGPAGIGC